MKKIILTMALAISSIAYSQVIIGDEQGTADDKTSVLLEFAKTNKGIILPYVRTLPTTPAEGTILLDASTPTDVRMKYFNGTWQDLSGQGADITTVLATQPTTVTESSEAKAIIGADTSTADGVLVLESTNKAMVLPTVDDVNNIPSPSPGMMVYVNKTGAKRLAVFNGKGWSFWMP